IAGPSANDGHDTTMSVGGCADLSDRRAPGAVYYHLQIVVTSRIGFSHRLGRAWNAPMQKPGRMRPGFAFTNTISLRNHQACRRGTRYRGPRAGARRGQAAILKALPTPLLNGSVVSVATR